MLNLGFFPSPAAAHAPSSSQEPDAAGEVRLKFHRHAFGFGVGYDLFIVIACVYCLYQSAVDDHAPLAWLAIRGALAVSELGRAPLCYLARVHSSAAWRHSLAASAVLFAFITAWNLFLPLNELMRALSAAPQETAAVLQEAEAAPERLRADEAQKRKDHEAAGQRVKDASAASGGLPPQHCFKRHCQSDPRVAAMNNELDAATKAEAAAKTALDKAEQKRREAEGPKGAAALRKAQDNHRHAVNKNIVYGAVATILGVDPVKISQAEMSWAMRLMTITVCVAAGLLGSVICLASVERLPVPAPATPAAAETIDVPAEGFADFAEGMIAVAEKLRPKEAAKQAAPQKPANDNSAPKRPRGRPHSPQSGRVRAPISKTMLGL